jgi:hypothetical protein
LDLNQRPSGYEPRAKKSRAEIQWLTTGLAQDVASV